MELIGQITAGVFLGVSLSTLCVNFYFGRKIRAKQKADQDRMDQLRWTLEKFSGEGQAGGESPES